ncbi:MAG: PQQ-binding-like beta-propeller repeat protein [Nanoarchaeota archaeon]|nr:PQQ-binding-like beta-propeller repeat protein [Nanoarchaeota archaeon]MBU1631592.1 PQQ-binding-like beta-propeller repeat protein [Nanoarchaeota archaeon]MBU1875482.1 PQQ-binding-like beta-propeller repeat protein [Nanoarchaeota archaeon]
MNKLTIVSVLILLGLVGFVSAENSESGNLSEWRMFGRYLNHTTWDGVAFPTISGLNNASYTAGNDFFSSPAVANGSVYVGNYDNKLYQFNASNVSQLIASYTAANDVNSRPAVVNGYVYVGSSDNKLYQLNASDVSQMIASYSTGTNMFIFSSPAIANGYIYFGNSAILNTTGYFYQLNASNISQQIANFSPGDRIYSSPAVTSEYVYIGSDDDNLYQLNASNVSQHIANYTTGSNIFGSPAVANGYVYIGSDDHKLYQLNASNVSQLIAFYATGGNIASCPAVANGYVYIGSNDNKLYQLNASNVSQVVAFYTTGGSIRYSSPTVAGGSIYVGSYDFKLYQLNASNVSQLLAYYTTGSLIADSPAVADDYVYIGSNDNKFYQLNASDISLGFDTINPIVTLNSPSAGYYNDSSASENITFNCSATDTVGLNAGLANISLYITNSQNTSFSLNQTTNINGTSNSSNWTLSLSVGNYIWNCLAYDAGGNSDWGYTNRSIIMNFTDSDNDGVSDNNDLLEGNEFSVSTTGITNLNITVGGNSTSGTYSGAQEIIFYDSADIMINFTHNFTASELDLSQITIIKAANSIIVNLSEQLQASYNKTLYIDDNNFVALCVKDAEISSISNVSSSCNGANETDFTTCLGNNTGVTLNGINCTDEGTRIKVKNLKHSAIKGTPATTEGEEEEVTTTTTGGGGGYVLGDGYEGMTEGEQTVQFNYGDVFVFTLKDKRYTIIVKKILGDVITIKINQMELTLKKGESQTVDTDGNGLDDFKATLLEVNKLGGKFTFNILEEMLEVAGVPEVVEEVPEEIAEKEEIPQEAPLKKEEIEEQVPESKLLWLWLILVVIVIAVVITIVVQKLKKKKRQ